MQNVLKEILECTAKIAATHLHLENSDLKHEYEMGMEASELIAAEFKECLDAELIRLYFKLNNKEKKNERATSKRKKAKS